MNSIFDRNKYGNKTIENFEIMSAYYVDIFYNHLYIEAKKLKNNGNVSSITEGYKHSLNAFLKGLDNPKLYKKSIVGIHNYFTTIGYSSISFSNCIDRLTKEFIPSDYFNSLSVTQKMGVLRMVLNQTMKVFIRKLVDSHLIKIIDYHKEVDNIRILQDELIDCFILEREGMYQRFISENTKINKNETVNRKISEKMQNEIKQLIIEKYKQIKIITAYKCIINNKNTEINNLKEMLGNANSHRVEQNKVDQNRVEQNRVEQNRVEQNRVEQNKVEQNKVEQNRVEQNRVEQNRVEQNRVEQNIVEQNIVEQNRVEQNRVDQDKVDQDKVDQDKVDQDKVDIESYNDESRFIEVDSNNINNIITSDNADLYSIKMDSGTMLGDFE
jgi:hypothetical protein